MLPGSAPAPQEESGHRLAALETMKILTIGVAGGGLEAALDAQLPLMDDLTHSHTFGHAC
jgi:hypothetical protein